MRWGKYRLPPGIRSFVGLLLMVGGVFGFLPVLGFWMFPLGLAFIALDIPFTAHRIDAWMVTLKARAEGNLVSSGEEKGEEEEEGEEDDKERDDR